MQLNQDKSLIDWDKIQYQDLDLIFKFGKSSNKIGTYESKPFIELPYGLVKIDIPHFIKENDFENCIKEILLSQYDEVDLSSVEANEVIAFILWVREQLEFIYHIETTYLHTEPKPELLASGIQRLDEFGAMTTIDNLAGGDILKYEKIKALPYSEVYQKLKLDKIQAEIREQYEKIITEKAKRK